MSRRQRAVPLATSPIVAMAERAAEKGALRGVLVYVEPDGTRFCISTPGMGAEATSGLMAMAIADMARAGEDGPEE